MATPRRRRLGDQLLQASGLFVMVIALGALAALLFDVLVDGASRLSWQFLTSLPSRRASQAGLATALVGSIYVILLTAVIAVPIGIGAAIYLEEYGKRGRMARLIEINIANLAGVPSIIYGLLGLGLFVRTLGLGRSLIAGAATLALLVLPVVILSTREALRTVPNSLARGLLRARRHQVADHLDAGAADGHAGHPDRAHPGAVAGDWRDGAAHHHRGDHLRAVPAGWAVVAVHGAPHPDFQLGVAAAGRVPAQRRGRYTRYC